MTRPPLESRADLEVLVDEFYARVRKDELIGPVFSHVDWDKHLPKIKNFWDTVMFGADNYEGRPFPPHVPLGLRVEHFERWLQLFFATVDEKFEGPGAEEIKRRAVNMGRNFLLNLEYIRRQNSGV